VEKRVVLAIDPGRKKCGMAVVVRDQDGKLHVLWRAIVPPTDVIDQSQEVANTFPFSMCLVGSGTTSESMVAALREAWPAIGVVIVDERESTLEARELYWQTIGRKGWRRLLPASLQVPPEDHDDFAAVVIASRFLDPQP
ncbi:MAG: pre-16S rRNA-processing nuclease YqgF, partial [bacterium]